MSTTEKDSKKVVEQLGFPLQTKLKGLSTVISLIDGYRINRCPDFRKLDDQIKKGVLGRPFAEKWKNIRKVLWRIGTFPQNIPNVNKMMTIRIVSQISGIIIMLIASSLVIAQLFLNLPTLIMAVGLGLYVLGTSLIGLAMLIRRRIAVKIAEFYYEDHERWKREQAYLKGVVQQLIDVLRRQIKRRKIAGTEKGLEKLKDNMSEKEYARIMEKYKMKMYNIDYTGIKIIKKPGTMRKNYVVLPKM